MYQALYRKWRPKTFADVVGQEHITATLQRQVAEGRLSHAYLFTGTRGTGKTTCAKILAKAVNCENPVDGNPCNACPSCLGIESGSFLDVMELDAASNNGVDSVRALRDEAIYSPAQVKRRVYIVDEVHMLSTAAFNALLKILEEPPEHLMFILATTELHKVPATILSRCQRFSFRRILPRDISTRLDHVAKAENIDLKPDGAELLARLSDGALRDALSLLDQCAASGGAVDAGSVLETLGLAGNVQTAQMMEFILRRDTKAALLLLGKLYAGGKDVGAVLGELYTLARDLLISTAAPEGGASLLSGGYDANTMKNLLALGSSARFVQLSTVLQTATAELQYSVNRRTDAELCLLKLCDETLSGDLAALGARIARLEEQIAAGAAFAASPAAQSASKVVETVPEAPKAPAPETPHDDAPWIDPPVEEEGPPPYGELVELPKREEPAQAVEAPPAPEVSAPRPSDDGDVYAQLMESYKNKLPVFSRAFVGNTKGRVAENTLTVYAPDDATKKMVDNANVLSVLEEVTSRAVGREVKARVIVGAPTGERPHDPMDDLVRLGSKFENFKIK